MNVPVLWTEVTVWHTGYTDPALRERKLQRDCKVLEAKLAERPEVARKTRASRLGWRRGMAAPAVPVGNSTWSVVLWPVKLVTAVSQTSCKGSCRFSIRVRPASGCSLF